MLRRFVSYVLLLFLVFICCSCNKQMVATQTYDSAIIKLQNGEVIECYINSWKDLGENNIEVTTSDGVTYRTNTYNVTLVQN